MGDVSWGGAAALFDVSGGSAGHCIVCPEKLHGCRTGWLRVSDRLETLRVSHFVKHAVYWLVHACGIRAGRAFCLCSVCVFR